MALASTRPLALGGIGVIEGYWLLSSSALHADVGLALFFGGAGLPLIAFIFWSEAGREALIARESVSPDERSPSELTLS
jgi:hypothetical protein